MTMNHHLMPPGPRRTSPAGDANVRHFAWRASEGALSSGLVLLLLCVILSGPGHAQSMPAVLQTADSDTTTVGSPFRSVFLIPDSRASEPTMMLSGSTYLVAMPPNLYQAIQDSLPGFAPWSPQGFCPDIHEYTRYRYGAHQAMSVVVSDFNNDGHRDLVVLGHDCTRAGHLGVVSYEGGYRFAFIGNGYGYDRSMCEEMFLEHLSPDEVRNACVRYEKPIPTEPLNGFCEHGETERPYWIGYYFIGGQFVIIGYSD
jgi:hypothetical protein